jgi:hypothetical protein
MKWLAAVAGCKPINIEVNKSVQGKIGKYHLRYLTLRAMFHSVFKPLNCMKSILVFWIAFYYFMFRNLGTVNIITLSPGTIIWPSERCTENCSYFHFWTDMTKLRNGDFLARMAKMAQLFLKFYFLAILWLEACSSIYCLFQSNNIYIIKVNLGLKIVWLTYFMPVLENIWFPVYISKYFRNKQIFNSCKKTSRMLLL